VKKHNDQMLSIVNEELVILDVIDEHEIYRDTMVTYEKAIALPTRILLKRNMLVELYDRNYNIEDRLVNGVDGIFKEYTKQDKDVDVVWIEFADTTIGKSQKNKHSQLYQQGIQQAWTPIL
jgi:hypothetical protein